METTRSVIEKEMLSTRSYLGRGGLEISLVCMSWLFGGAVYTCIWEGSLFLAWQVGELGWAKLEKRLEIGCYSYCRVPRGRKKHKEKTRRRKALRLIWKNFQSAGDVMNTENDPTAILRFQKHNNIPRNNVS